ncbi:MAG: hypothetical protein G01um10148_208 [Parcubacteria group bacterium Gr01-1014_8]|nr:MAG: hypothetical protein G01um10148_208 [Parcubacteria group bacterium Gr01-1014_8]
MLKQDEHWWSPGVRKRIMDGPAADSKIVDSGVGSKTPEGSGSWSETAQQILDSLFATKNSRSFEEYLERNFLTEPRISDKVTLQSLAYARDKLAALGSDRRNREDGTDAELIQNAHVALVRAIIKVRVAQESTPKSNKEREPYKDPTIVTAAEVQQSAIDTQRDLHIRAEQTEHEIRVLLDKLFHASILGKKERQSVVDEIETYVKEAKESIDERRYAYLQMSLASVWHSLQDIERKKEPSAELLAELSKRAYDELYGKLRETARALFNVELDSYALSDERDVISVFTNTSHTSRLHELGLTAEEIDSFRIAAGFLQKHQSDYRLVGSSAFATKLFLGSFNKVTCRNHIENVTVALDKALVRRMRDELVQLLPELWNAGVYKYTPEVIIDKMMEKADAQYQAGFRNSYSRLRPKLEEAFRDAEERLRASGVEATARKVEFNEEEWALDAILSENRARLEYLEFINPSNGAAEKAKFFDALKRGEEYNPQLEYAVKESQEQALKLASHTIERAGRMVKTGPNVDIFVREIVVQERTLEFIRGIGAEHWSQRRAERLFGRIDRFLLDDTVAELKEMPSGFFENGGENLSKDEVRTQAMKALKDVGASDWSFDFHAQENVPSVVLASRKQVFFQKREVYPEQFVNILIAHEIYGHVAQDNNALKHGVGLLQSGLGNYEPLMEGFALDQERKVNPLTELRIKFYYAAVAHAAKHSLHDTFQYLKRWLPDEDAYALASRVKRGMRDTSKPGTWLKDKIYLEGLTELDHMSAEDQALVRHGKFEGALTANVRRLVSNRL